jgi:glutamate mutase epsilon subunit
MAMVKNLYESGDESMKKGIVEAFEKSKQREVTGMPF